MGRCVGAQADLWRVEPFGYLSEDADVWAIVTGAAVAVWRSGLGRFSVRFGTEIVLHGPAVEPGAHPLVGVGACRRALRGCGYVDRAADFTLKRAGFFVTLAELGDGSPSPVWSETGPNGLGESRLQ